MVEGVIWLNSLWLPGGGMVAWPAWPSENETLPAVQSDTPCGGLGVAATMKWMWSVRNDSLRSGNTNNSQGSLPSPPIRPDPVPRTWSSSSCLLLSLLGVLSLLSYLRLSPATCTFVCQPGILMTSHYNMGERNSLPTPRPAQLRLLTLIDSWELTILGTHHRRQ